MNMDEKQIKRLFSVLNFETKTFNHDKFISAFSIFILAHKNEVIPEGRFKVSDDFIFFLNYYLHLLDDPDEEPEPKGDEVSDLVDKILVSIGFFVGFLQDMDLNVKTFGDLAVNSKALFLIRKYIRRIATHTSLNDVVREEFGLDG